MGIARQYLTGPEWCKETTGINMNQNQNQTNQNKNAFINGIRDGIPIALGYFAVAFSLGIVAKKAGLNPVQGFISSMLNHASAGEYAEFTVIMANAPYVEMAFVI